MSETGAYRAHPTATIDPGQTAAVTTGRGECNGRVTARRAAARRTPPDELTPAFWRAAMDAENSTTVPLVE